MIKDSVDFVFIAENFIKILGALPVTIAITLASLFFGWCLGLLIATGKIQGPAWLKEILKWLTDIIRGIPTVVLLYVVYFGLPQLVSALTGANISNWSKQTFVIIALALELGINSSEMFRSAYSSIKKGQLEAAWSLGYTKWQRFTKVIFPQGLYVILPNLSSAVLSIIQATALVYTLGIYDILGKARQIDTNEAHVKTFEMYLAVAAIYWGLSIIVVFVFKKLEAAFGKGNVGIAAKEDTSKVRRKKAVSSRGHEAEKSAADIAAVGKAVSA